MVLAKSADAESYRHRLRRKVIKAYGGSCACCGEDQFEFLTMDHINGGGTKHIRSFSTYTQYMRYLLLEVQRADYRVLCYNCNMARARYGSCPHGNGI